MQIKQTAETLIFLLAGRDVAVGAILFVTGLLILYNSVTVEGREFFILAAL